MCGRSLITENLRTTWKTGPTKNFARTVFPGLVLRYCRNLLICGSTDSKLEDTRAGKPASRWK